MPPPSPAADRPPLHHLDAWSGLFAFALTAILFWPVSRWVLTHTLPHEQLKNALLVLVAAVALTIWRHGHGRGRPWQFTWSRLALALLAGAYAALGATLWFKTGWLMLAGAILALAAAGVFALGSAAWRLVAGIAFAAAAYVGIVLAFPLLDWPLRQMSGVYSAELLRAIGLAPELTVSGRGQEVLLLLRIGARTFEVATECNGFGTIAATTLLALLLGLSSREPWWWKVLLLPAAAATGMVCNLLRILTICLLAPVFPQHYAILHEIAGLLALFGALALVWWQGTPRERARPPGSSARPPAEGASPGGL